ncbi:MAG TPA: hypothetical protein VF483_11485 [Gemmatimonadaceae bacterium]
MRGRSLVRLEAGAGSATRASAEPLRWEWRTFAKRGDPRLQSLVPAGAMSEPTRQETYIVSARSVNNVKVRDGFVEVKTLERRSDSGLELWRPALRGALPIAAAVVRRLCAAWHVPAPDLHLLSYGLGDLVQDVVAVEKDLAAIPVSKRRTRISPHGCQGEWTCRSRAKRGGPWPSKAPIPISSPGPS